MKLNLSKASVIFALVAGVFVVPVLSEGEWKDVSIALERSIGSAIAAAAQLRARYSSMVKAQRWIHPDPSWDLYRVQFIAVFRGGVHKFCQADVTWTIDGRTVENESCTSLTTVQQH